MTQNSDSGDAVGDAGPATDRPAYCCLKVKKEFFLDALAMVQEYSRDQSKFAAMVFDDSDHGGIMLDLSIASRQKLPT
jgi:hypothetical protein